MSQTIFVDDFHTNLPYIIMVNNSINHHTNISGFIDTYVRHALQDAVRLSGN